MGIETIQIYYYLVSMQDSSIHQIMSSNLDIQCNIYDRILWLDLDPLLFIIYDVCTAHGSRLVPKIAK